MVIHLLTLGGSRAEKRAAGVYEILPALVHVALDEEVLLLGADHGGDGGDVVVAEELEHAHGLLAERLHAAQQRRLLVKRFAAVGAEGGGYIEHAVADKGVAGGVPGGVAARLKGGAQSAGGEAGRVRLAVDKLLAGELHQHATVAVGLDEAVVLLGGDARHGLEPVRKVRRALFERPVAHGLRDDLGGVGLEPAAAFHSPEYGRVRLRRQPLAHDCVGEHHRAEYLLYPGHL